MASEEGSGVASTGSGVGVTVTSSVAGEGGGNLRSLKEQAAVRHYMYIVVERETG